MLPVVCEEGGREAQRGEQGSEKRHDYHPAMCGCTALV